KPRTLSFGGSHTDATIDPRSRRFGAGQTRARRATRPTRSRPTRPRPTGATTDTTVTREGLQCALYKSDKLLDCNSNRHTLEPLVASLLGMAQYVRCTSST